MLAQKDERYQGVEKHSSGFKLLASMGWKEGEGLVSCSPQTESCWLCPDILGKPLLSTLVSMQGAKRQGMKHHIKVKKVQENAGIGLVRIMFCQAACFC